MQKNQLAIVKLRANLLAKIRAFFMARNVLEVETPLLCHSTNPSPQLENFMSEDLYLQSSPEFAMKRLLAAGSGDIYQICKAFRKSEMGRRHNPEFTILEWYRVGFDHCKLMAEMEEFLQWTINAPAVMRFSYGELFANFFQIDPYRSNLKQLQDIAAHYNLAADLANTYDEWLQLLFSHHIEPNLGKTQPVFVYDFPPEQAMLAKIRSSEPPVAERFEVYFKGIELANGFHELNNADEQRGRFLKEIEERKKMQLPLIPCDERFLAALPHLPNCAGVALGIDRLLLIATNTNSLAEIMNFTFADV